MGLMAAGRAVEAFWGDGRRAVAGGGADGKALGVGSNSAAAHWAGPWQPAAAQWASGRRGRGHRAEWMIQNSVRRQTKQSPAFPRLYACMHRIQRLERLSTCTASASWLYGVHAGTWQSCWNMNMETKPHSHTSYWRGNGHFRKVRVCRVWGGLPPLSGWRRCLSWALARRAPRSLLCALTRLVRRPGP